MLSLNHPKIKVWALRLFGLLLALLLLFWAGCHLFLPRLIQKNLTQYGEKIGYVISYDDLSLSPLRLQLQIDGLSLAKEGGQHLLDFKKLLINLKWGKLMLGELAFDQILLDEPQILIEKPAQKFKIPNKPAALWNWQELMGAVEKSLPPKDPAQAKQPLKISIDELEVSGATLLLVDVSNQLRERLKPFSIKLLDVANYDQHGLVAGVRGQYDLNLGALQIMIPKINKTLSFAHIALGGGLDNVSPDSLGVQLNLKLDEGKILSHWDFNTVTKNTTGKVQIENIATAPFIALLPANKDLVASSGVLNADLAVQLNSTAKVISGNMNLANLAVFENGEKTPLIKWDNANIRQWVYRVNQQANMQTSNLTIDEVIIEHPALRFEINPQGLSNFRRLFAKPQAEGGASNETDPFTDQPTINQLSANQPSTNQPSTNQPSTKDLFGLDIRSIAFKSGDLFFADYAMRPNFKVDVKKFNASFLGVSNQPGHSASLSLDGVVANSGSLRAKGQASFDDPRRNHDIVMSFKNLPLTTFSPAVMTYAGYQIASGSLNLNLNYRAKDGQLNGSNQIIIKRVQLGDEVADFQGKKLPLGLAIALLEDADDTIDVTIRIAGNVDSPQFSASGLVWQAISNVLTNVATAPFRALASILGMSGDEGVNAVPGEAVFLPVDQERLEKFGDYLVKRPNASIEILGTYDPVQDKQELARVKADTAILQAAGFKLEMGEPVPLPSLSDPRIQAGLRSAYAQYIGRIQLGQRLLMLPDGEARNEQLHAELIAGIEVTDAQLQQLAKNRAELASTSMTKENPDLKDRISVGGVKVVEASKDGVPLDVKLRIK